jgi:urease accessory protein
MTGTPRSPLWLVWQIADSAFPTGGFAHSLGLEAAWQAGEVVGRAGLHGFLRDTLLQVGHGSLPLVTAAFRAPGRWPELDALNDAFLINPVANRASRVQGRAWASTCARIWPSDEMAALSGAVPALCGHAAPLTGVMLRAVGLPLWTIQELVLFQAARGVLSAAVRLGITGSYDAQRLLHDAAPDLGDVLARCADLDETDLAQTAPILDIVHASHDRLYSRLFQS